MGFPVSETGVVELKRGKGCRECRGTGYKRRSAIFEIFPMSSLLKKMTVEGESSLEMRRVAIREGMTTLREDAWSKVKAGITTVEEALRVTAET
jgi:general secretion pathway protein E